MLVEIYQLLILLATLASYNAIRKSRKSEAETYISAGFATFTYVLVSVGSVNIQKDVGGTLTSVSNEYLVLLWGAMAFVMLLFIVVAEVENIAEAGSGATDFIRGNNR
ncbi:hypothetical protein [Haloarchaeobius sp. DFWS5]|uniref:hypothetical protein n=1 Tax=Haloarchaeobius sp. DFWS5 TaxID=3446114 RepID=UPI003EBC7218